MTDSLQKNPSKMLQNGVFKPFCNNLTKSNNIWMLLIGFFLSFLTSTLLVANEKVEYNLQPLTKGVYWHLGQHLSVQAAGREDISNSGVVVGERCVAVIDSGGSLSVGKQLLAAIRMVTQLPICYVINTHIHFDHLLGNAAFTDKDTEFVGHYQLANAVKNNQAFFQKRFPTELAGAELIIPSILVKGKQQLDLGGRVLELRAWPIAHTNTDLTVYDLTSGVIWSGDLVFRERLPILDGSLLGWLSVMKQLRTLPVQNIIPGHGPKATNWDEALTEQKRYLQKLLTEVREKIAQNVFLADAIKTVAQSEAKHWQLFESGHRRNVSRAFRQLEWE